MVEEKQFDAAEKIKEVTDIYNRVGVREAAMAKIGDYLEKSRGALEK